MTSNSKTSTDLNVKNRPQRVIKRPRLAEFYYGIDQVKKEPDEGRSGTKLADEGGSKPTGESSSVSKPVEESGSAPKQADAGGSAPKPVVMEQEEEEEPIEIDVGHHEKVIIVSEAQAYEEEYEMEPMEKPKKKRGRRSIKTEKPQDGEKPQDEANKQNEETPVKVKKERKKRTKSTTLADYLPGADGEAVYERQFFPDPGAVEFELGTTNKNGICVWRDGFRYLRNRQYFWRCSHRDCQAKAKVWISEEGLAHGTHQIEEHNHPAENERKEAERLRAEIKRKIRGSPWMSQSKMLAEARAIAPDEKCVAAMGSDVALRQMMHRTAAKQFGNANKKNVLDIVFDEELVIKDGANTLIYDSRETRQDQKDVVLVFSHPELLEVLLQNPRWSVGSSTHNLPRPFTHCLVLGAFIGETNKMAVCARALLVGKQKKSYVEALNVVKAALGEVYPQSVISDFDVPLLAAIKTVFPEVPLYGCNFGLKLWRKFYSMRMDKLIWDPQIGCHVRETFRRILSLPLLPPEEVRRAFGLIIDLAPMQMTDFFYYFAKVYIGLTDIEIQLGPDAFKPGTVMREQRTITSEAGVPTIVETIIPRWKFPVATLAKFSIEFWNHGDEAAKALTLINNSMGGPILRDLKFRPAMSDFVLAIQADMDEQLAIAHSATIIRPQSSNPNAIQEQKVIAILNRAQYDHDTALINLVTQLGVHVQGCVPALVRKKQKKIVKREVKLEEEDGGQQDVKTKFGRAVRIRQQPNDQQMDLHMATDGEEEEVYVEVDDGEEGMPELEGGWVEIYDEDVDMDEEEFEVAANEQVVAAHQIIIDPTGTDEQEEYEEFDPQMPSTSAAAAAVQPRTKYVTRRTHLIIK